MKKSRGIKVAKLRHVRVACGKQFVNKLEQENIIADNDNSTTANLNADKRSGLKVLRTFLLDYLKFFRLIPRRRLTFWISIIAIIILRMILVAKDEIVPIGDDSANYARQSVYYLSGGSFGGLPQQSPGLFYLAIVGANLGIPYKLFLDSLLVLVALGTSLLVKRITRSELCGLFSFAAIALNPWFMNHSQLFMSEPLMAVLLLATVVSCAQFLAVPFRRWNKRMAATSTLAMTAWALTRPEMPIVYGFWLLFVFATGLCHRRRLRGFWKFRTGKAKRWVLLLAPLVISVMTIWAINQIHQSNFGVAALSVGEAPGLNKLISALYSIPPEQKIRFAPVTYQSLTAACDASPTMNTVRNWLLSRSGGSYLACERNLKLPGEVGTWLNWQLVSSFGGNSRESNEKMIQAAEEIRLAQEQGRLGYRNAVFPLDPLWREWITDLPNEFRNSLTLSFFPNFRALSSLDQFSKRRVTDSVDFGFFDDGLLRRKGTAPEQFVRIHGQTDVSNSAFRSVRLFSSEKQLISRSSITKAIGNGWEFKFAVPPGEWKGKLVDLTLVFHSNPYNEDSRAEVRLSHDLNHVWFSIDPPTSSASPNVPQVWQISVSYPPRGKLNRTQLKTWFRHNYWSMVSCMLFVTFLLGTARKSNLRRRQQIRWLLLVAIGLLVGRSLFYALVQVWLHWGLHRYVEPHHLFVLLILFLFAYSLGTIFRQTFRKLFQRELRETDAIFQTQTNDLVQVETDGV